MKLVPDVQRDAEGTREVGGMRHLAIRMLHHTIHWVACGIGHRDPRSRAKVIDTLAIGIPLQLVTSEPLRLAAEGRRPADKQNRSVAFTTGDGLVGRGCRQLAFGVATLQSLEIEVAVLQVMTAHTMERHGVA